MGFSELLCFILFGFIFFTFTPKMCIKTLLPGKEMGVFFPPSFLWAPQHGVIELLGDCKRLSVSACSRFSPRFKPSMMSWIGVSGYCWVEPSSLNSSLSSLHHFYFFLIKSKVGRNLTDGSRYRQQQIHHRSRCLELNRKNEKVHNANDSKLQKSKRRQVSKKKMTAPDRNFKASLERLKKSSKFYRSS